MPFLRFFIRSNAVLVALCVLVVPGALAQAPSSGLEIVVLGSGGPGATGRAGASYLVLIDGRPRIIVDAGPGAFARLGEENLSLHDTSIVLLTHLHVDHAGELAGMFKARAVSGGDRVQFDVWGPAASQERAGSAHFPSTTRFLALLFGKNGAFAYLPAFAAPMTIRGHDIAVGTSNSAIPRVVFREHGIVVTTMSGHHADAPSVIYRIDYKEQSVTFSGDIDAHGLRALERIAKGSDLLVFNSVVLDPPGSPRVLYELHTPPMAIGQLARDAGVHHLVLSHLSPAVESQRDEVLASIRKSYPGPVVFAEDRMHVKP